MKILFLTDNFPPEVNAPATRTYEHCKEWVKQPPLSKRNNGWYPCNTDMELHHGK